MAGSPRADRAGLVFSYQAVTPEVGGTLQVVAVGWEGGPASPARPADRPTQHSRPHGQVSRICL